MKQLKLRDGDLVLGPGGFDVVEGAPRLSQDLGCAVREEIGTDRFHPAWGSLLNSYIGLPADIETTDKVRTEVGRVLQNYIVVQTDQYQKDADAGLRSRFKPGDLIVSVPSVETQRRTDQINVRATVNTSSGEVVTVVRSVEAE